MEENFLIHGPVRRCPVLVFPIHILGEEGESLRVGRREVSLGDFRVYAWVSTTSASRRAGRQAGKPRLLLFVVTPNRTSQSIFPIARET